MAATKQKKPSKQNRKYQGNMSKSASGSVMILGVGILVLGLLAFGTVQVLGPGNSQNEGTAAGVGDIVRYLGPASDPAGLALAEQGALESPTLVWFHADWCHVCQQIKPEVVDIGQAYEGKVRFVRLNVDHSESREAVQRYGVRATPTFVLIDADGQIRGNVPGWPGYQAFTGAFEQLLIGG